MIVKLPTEHHLELLSLKEGSRGSSESTHVKMPHCWKSHALAHIICTCFSSLALMCVRNLKCQQSVYALILLKLERTL